MTRTRRRRVEYLLHGLLDDDAWPSEDRLEEMFRRFLKALAEVDTEELHYFAMNFNWDDDCKYLHAVIDHPLCDQGTALMIFWLGEPSQMYHEASKRTLRKCPGGPEVFALLKAIERKTLSGGFTSRRIAVDPRAMFSNNWVDEIPDEPGLKLIPRELKAPSPGQRLKEIDL